MPTKQTTRGKRPSKTSNRKTSTLRATNERLQGELQQLRAENRQLKRSLGALLFKDVPKNLDLKPDDGVMEPPVTELIAQLQRAGK